jgi:hypothetical protein
LANARTPQLFSRFCSVLGTFRHSFFIKKKHPNHLDPTVPHLSYPWFIPKLS